MLLVYNPFIDKRQQPAPPEVAINAFILGDF
jgi:hypothetical protein